MPGALLTRPQSTKDNIRSGNAQTSVHHGTEPQGFDLTFRADGFSFPPGSEPTGRDFPPPGPRGTGRLRVSVVFKPTVAPGGRAPAPWVGKSALRLHFDRSIKTSRLLDLLLWVCGRFRRLPGGPRRPRKAHRGPSGTSRGFRSPRGFGPKK